MTERALVVNFLGNTAGLEAALKRTSAQLNGFQTAGASLQGVGKSMTRNLTLPIVGFGVAAAAAAVKFQQSMELLHTQAGVSQQAVGRLSRGVLDMAASVGTTPQDLAAGMYHVASSLNATLAPTTREATELKILRIAAEGAQVGHANLVDVTNALDAAVVSGIKGVQNYSQAMGALNAVVGAGDMTMQDLADALSTGLLAPMQRYGLTLKEVGGALAVFGDNNIRGQEAATKLISAVRIMAAPSKAAAKELAGVGISTGQLGDDIRKGGLVLALQDLQKHLQDSGLTATQQGVVIARSFGGRQSTGVQVLLGQLDRLKAKTEEVGKGAQGFGQAWSATTQTAAFKIHSAWAGLQADLTRFGDDVLPTFLKIGSTVVKDADKIAHAFTSLPKGAQDAIIKGGLILAAIGPALRLLGVFTGGLGRLWAIAQKIQAWGAVTQTAAGKTPLGAAAGRQLAASVGTMEVGTLIARSSVAPMAGGAGGSAAGTAGKTAAKDAESAAAKEATTVETGIAGGGLVSNIKSGLGKVAGGALKGATIAGLGTLFSQSIGAAIHGAVGKAISTIGTDSSIGAGIGTVFGPEGTIPGALLGGLVGAFQTFIKHPSGGEKISAKIFAGGFGGKQAPSLAKQTASALDTLSHFTVKPGPTHDDMGNILRPTSTHLNISGLSPEDAAKAMAAANKAGGLVARQLEAGWNQYRFQSEPIMFSQFRDKFKHLPPEAQARGADLAIKFAAGLERAGRLPVGQTDKMIRDIEQQFPGMWRFIGLTASDGAKQFYKAMDLSRTEKNVGSQLRKISRDFPQVQQAMAYTNGTIGAKSAAAVKALRQIATHGSGPMRRAAKQDLDLLRGTTSKDLSALVSLTDSKAKAMAAAIRDGSKSALNAVDANFGKVQNRITTAMAIGLISVQKASKLIGQALNAMLATENAALSPKSLAQWEKFWSFGAPAGRQTQALGHRNERGSMFQFGRAGDRGKDMIPVNFGGRQIVVGSGEMGMVLTGDQQAVLNERTADLGGLPGVFATHNRPHSMGFASGGDVHPHGHPLFRAEGPRFYDEAYKFFRPYAKPGPYQLQLPHNREPNFRDWLHRYHVPFNPNARVADYDMRRYWWRSGGKPYRGGHFPDTFKTPYDTTFSRESIYATANNPFDWVGNVLVNLRTGQRIFGERTYADGGIVRGFARGGVASESLPQMSQMLKGAKFATGGTVWGVNPTTHQKVKHTKAEWASIWATYRRKLSAHDRAIDRERARRLAHSENPSGSQSGSSSQATPAPSGGPVTWGIDPRTHQRVKHTKSDWGKVWAGYRAGFASIPSQDDAAQIKMTLLANELIVAQNKGDTVAQQKALTAEAKLGQSWLAADKKRLTQIKHKLDDRSISGGFHSALLADELALLQEIGTVQSNIGTANSSLTDGSIGGSGGSGSSGSSSQFDLGPGSITLPTVYDVHRAVAATIAAQPHVAIHHHGDRRLPIPVGAHRQPVSHHIPVYNGDRRAPVLTGEQAQSVSHHHHHHGGNTFHLHVADKRDVPAVADAIDRVTGSRLKAQLRMNGLRGT